MMCIPSMLSVDEMPLKSAFSNIGMADENI